MANSNSKTPKTPKTNAGTSAFPGSSLMSRFMLALRAGWQFAGKRKLYDVFGYPTALTTEMLMAKYQRQDLSARIVDMPPEDMWTDPPILKADGDINEATAKIWTDFVQQTNFLSRVVQADKLLAFGPFSVIFIGLPGNLESPAPKVSKPEQILYLQAFGRPNVDIDSYVTDVKNPRFGQPEMYKIKVASGSSNSLDLKVHYSRVIHVVDRPLQGQLEGVPRLEQVYNILDDMLKVGGGSAELYWLTANRGMQVDIDKDMDLSAEDATELSNELDEFQHQLRRYVRTRGVKVTPLGGEVADPRGVFEVLVSILAGSTSIPQRILMGAEAGQLASEQDRANWAVYMQRRRKIFAEPYILKPTLMRLEDLGLMPKGTSKIATFVWPPAFKMNPLEDAQTLAAKGRAVANFTRRAQYGNPLITDEEARRMLDLPSKPAEGETMPEMVDPRQGDEEDGEDGEDGGADPNKESGGDPPSAVREPPTGEDAPDDPRPATSSVASLREVETSAVRGVRAALLRST